MSAAEANGAKNELPYMTVMVAEELAIAEDLSNEELGALYRLKLKLWRANGYLPEDKLVAASKAGRRWGAIMRAVLDHITVIGGKFSSGAVLLGLESVRKRRAERAERGAKAAKARWEVERVHRSGKSLSDVSASSISDALLKATNSLSELSPTMLGASTEQCLAMPNQIQIEFDNSNTSPGDSAASGAAAGSGNARASRSAVAMNADQRVLVFQHGIALLNARCGLKKLSAHAQMQSWLAEIGDADRLILLLGLAERQKLTADEFCAFVDQQARADAAERAADCPQGSGQVDAARVVAVDDVGNAELWLATTARKLVVERLSVTPARAEMLLERWLRRVNGSHRDLAEIVAGAAAPRLNGKLLSPATFDLTIGEECDRRRDLIEKGATMPMGPVVPGRSPTPAANPSAHGRIETEDAVEEPQRKAVGDGT